jgi:hypothetical protein
VVEVIFNLDNRHKNKKALMPRNCGGVGYEKRGGSVKQESKFGWSFETSIMTKGESLIFRH